MLTMTVGVPWAAVSIPAEARQYATKGSQHAYILDEERATWLYLRSTTRSDRWEWRRVERYITRPETGTEFAVPEADRRAEHGYPYWVAPGRSAGYVSLEAWVAGGIGVITLPQGEPAKKCPLCCEPLWPEDRVTVLMGRWRRSYQEHGTVHRTCADERDLRPPGPGYDWGCP
ncbi:hypothetical protein [Streptomyces sp. NPDC048644]|uniref:hypothetical protein n=1 Tax=Streptomyces sp. NPDC048644 TaxID=3365582 RepID=UPI0037187158